jgi:uncharacterized membrane protein
MNDARTDVGTAGTRADFNLTVKRNCSISPRALCWLLASIAGLSFGIAAVFALYGAWPILPFAGLEVAVLAAAFYVNGRHAIDYERIALADGCLVVEIRDGDRIAEHRFDAHWVRLVVTDARDPRVALRFHGRELEIGRHLDASGRRRLASALRERLDRANATGGLSEAFAC